MVNISVRRKPFILEFSDCLLLYGILCFVLAIVMCVITASLLWSVVSILVMLVTFLVGGFNFAIAEELIYGNPIGSLK